MNLTCQHSFFFLLLLLFSYYRNDGGDRFYRGEYEPYRKKDDPYPERYRENWTGRREPEGWSIQNYIKCLVEHLYD